MLTVYFYAAICVEKYTGQVKHTAVGILARFSFCVLNSMWPAARPNFARLGSHHIRVWISQFHSPTPAFIASVNSSPCHQHFLSSHRLKGVTEPTKYYCNAFQHDSVRLGEFPFLLEKGKLKKSGGVGERGDWWLLLNGISVHISLSNYIPLTFNTVNIAFSGHLTIVNFKAYRFRDLTVLTFFADVISMDVKCAGYLETSANMSGAMQLHKIIHDTAVNTQILTSNDVGLRHFPTPQTVWVTALYRVISLFGRFGRTCCLQLQGDWFTFRLNF